MGIERIALWKLSPACLGRALVFAISLTALPGLAAAQQAGHPTDSSPQNVGFFDAIGHWFDQQANSLNLSVDQARRQMTQFGQEAGAAARVTVDGAQDAAGAVARIPHARIVSGYERCAAAANGAPNCLAAADAVCKAKGFGSGRSIDMTTAEICPPRVWMAGRNSGAGCHTETFVSRAICQ
jgi:hypothetical protein